MSKDKDDKDLYIDCDMGAAGDMIAAALSAFLKDPEKIAEQINNMGLKDAVASFGESMRNGIEGKEFNVEIGPEEETTEDVYEEGIDPISQMIYSFFGQDDHDEHEHYHDHEHYAHEHYHDHEHYDDHEHYHDHEHYDDRDHYHEDYNDHDHYSEHYDDHEHYHDDYAHGPRHEHYHHGPEHCFHGPDFRHWGHGPGCKKPFFPVRPPFMGMGKPIEIHFHLHIEEGPCRHGKKHKHHHHRRHNRQNMKQRSRKRRNRRPAKPQSAAFTSPDYLNKRKSKAN